MNNPTNTSYDVVIYKTRTVKGASKRPHNVRWKVGKLKRSPFSEYYATSGLAKSFVSKLTTAMSNGEAFDMETGLPPSIQRERRTSKEPTFLALARDYAHDKWTRNRGNSRVGTAAMLVDIVAAVMPRWDQREKESDLRVALRHWVFKKPSKSEHEPPDDVSTVLKWAENHCPKVSEVAVPDRLRSVLDRLRLNLNGTEAKPSTFEKRRVILYAVFEFAITQKLVSGNPLKSPDLRWERPKKLKVVAAIKPQQVGNTAQVENLLMGVGYVGAGQGPRFVAFFACMYFAMMRPEEVIGLYRDHCELPARGWGKLRLEESEPAPGKSWTDSGRAHERQELKHRGEGETRTIPIPPRLVELLRSHIAKFGTAPDGRVFRSVNGNPVYNSTYKEVLRKARALSMGPVEGSGLRFKRAYDLRHSGIVLRLYAGVPTKQVALWAGHSVEVLLRTYDNVLEGFDDRWQRQIDDFLDA